MVGALLKGTSCELVQAGLKPVLLHYPSQYMKEWTEPP